MKQFDLVNIQRQIGYEFKNLDLLQQAFTRRSFSEENGGENNEVLEFIGDKVLDLFVVKLLITQNSNSIELYERFKFLNRDGLSSYNPALENEDVSFSLQNEFVSKYAESELTEIKKLLVQKKALADRIDNLGIARYLIMGSGDVLQNIGEENSVKEDLFEAILGAIAIDCNWDFEKLQNAVEIMLSPNSILDDGDTEDYVALIEEWSYYRVNGVPQYIFEMAGYQITWYTPFDGISQNLNSNDEFFNKTKHHCFLKIANHLPIFRGFGKTQYEAKKNACKLAYEYLCKEGYWLSIRDEIDCPNKDDAINQLEILARRGYFSIPTYVFKQTHDKDGNPIWESICHIAEKEKSFSEKSSSKKDAKKSAAYKMLQYVLND